MTLPKSPHVSRRRLLMKLRGLCGHSTLLEWGLVFIGRGISHGRWRRCVTGRGCQSLLSSSHTSHVLSRATANNDPFSICHAQLSTDTAGLTALLHERAVQTVIFSKMSLESAGLHITYLRIEQVIEKILMKQREEHY